MSAPPSTAPPVPSTPGSGGRAGSGRPPGPAPRRPAPRRSGWRSLAALALAVTAAVACGLVAFALAPLGMNAVYAIVGLIGVGLAAFTVRDLLAPALADARSRLAPRPSPGGGRPRRLGSAALLVAAVLASGVVAWGVAQSGMKAVVALVAVVLVAVLVWLFRPLIDELLRTPPEDLPEGSTRSVGPPAAASHPRPRGRPARAAGMAMTVIAAGALAWGAAQMGLKGLIALVGAIGVTSLLVSARDRSLCFTFAAVCSLTFVLHKSFGPQDLQLSGGAPSVYVSTFDAMVLLLYGIWIAEGTFADDVRAAARRRILLLPLAGALLLLPSVLVATSVSHAVAELFRMAWMYLLFFYVAVRVRTRRHAWAVLGGLAVMACVELVVVVLQAKTGGVLGLSFLGVPTQLGERVTDAGALGRPFGTIIHPVFMGAVMGSLGLLALSLGLTLARSLTKVAALALVPVCVLPLYLAHTRASLVAFAMVAFVVVGVAIVRGDLAWRTVGRVVAVGLVGVVLLWPQLTDKFFENFATGHFTEEVDSRRELNDLAGHMIEDHPITGVGLNNFEVVMAPYERYGVIFFGNPVHNLYLLYLSETGVVGFAGVVIVGVGLYNVALRLARSRDPMLGGVGIGVSAVMAFLMIEELLGFSLRQDIPLALYWLLAGLAVSCFHLAGFDGGRSRSSRPPRRRRPWPERAGKRESAREPDTGSNAGAPVDAALRHAARDLRIALVAGKAGRAVWPADAAAGAGAPTPWLPLDEAYAMALEDPAPTGSAPPPGAPLAAGVRPRRHPRRPSLRWVAAAIAVVAGALVVAGGAPSEASSTANLKITFTATERATGIQGIYVANGDGTGVRRITPGDGRQYNWAQWAFGGTKIVATVRAGAEGSPEDIVLMDPDGGNLRTVVAYRFRVGQPKVAGDGRSIVFTGTTPWFREIALYRLDLETLEATNLSAVTSPLGSLDADPKFAPDGRVIFASGADDHTDIATMATDGSDRRTITSDRYFNTDPEVSPDGASIAIASYRGDGNPGQPGRISTVGVKPDHWYLVVRDASTGAERVLTGGQSCIERLPDRACRPEETSAFKPVWTPDGRAIGYNGTLDRFHNCICVIGADGRNARVLLAPDGLALDWFDWTERAAAPSGAAAIGSKVRPSRVLVTSAGADGTVGLYSASPDLLHRTPLPLPPGMVPTEASWNAQHGRVVFTADAPVPAAGAPHPAPPPGERRRDHVTLDDLDPVRRHLRDAEASGDGAPAVDPRRQVFLREPGGAVRQLTDPWIEDWRDGLTEGDLRSNTDPVLSPDGRSVVVTNRSSVTGESFLLRISIDGGEVLNLTNGSAGALPVDDAGPAFSPDGTHLAFTWTYGSAAEVAVTDAAEGRTVTRLTDDDWYDTAPTWNADGQSVTYSSYRGEGSPVTDDGRPKPAGWVLVRRDLRGGPEQVLGTAGAPAWLPSASPEGDLVVAIGIGPSSAEILAVAPGSPSAGDRRGVAALAGAPAATLRWLQPTPFDNELFVDWR